MNGSPRLVLGAREHTAVVDHVLAAYPHEAVGLLGGDPDGVVRRVAPLTNLADEWQFFADPLDQFRALASFRAAGHTPLAVYHSHPDGGLTLSAADVHFARELAFLQVVVAVRPDEMPPTRMRAYRVSALGDVEEVGPLVDTGVGGK